MPWDLLIRGGEVVTLDGVRKLGVAIEDGSIVELAPDLIGQSRETIDATGLHIFPGLIDPHVHFNEPGRTEWEGFATGSAALAAGGGTCFFDMPLNSSPPVLDGPTFDAKRAAAERNSLTDFALWGGLTPDNLDKLEELAARGVVGFKAFMCDSGIDEFASADGDVLREGMRRVARLGLPVAVHAESQALIVQPNPKWPRTHRRAVDAFLESRPLIAETTAIARAIDMAEETGCTLHVVHVSHWQGVDLIREAQSRGVDVTCETCAHYLALSAEDAAELGGLAKCAPPLRSRNDQPNLWDRLHDGYLAFVTSDHSPAPPHMKTGDDFLSLWGGIAGVQSTRAVLFAHNPHLSADLIARLTSTNVADRFRLPNKGKIAIGHDADLALIDLNATYTLTRDMLLARHKLSPYVGRTFRGLVRRTIVRGHTIFHDGRITVGNFRGRLIKPTPRIAAERKPADA
jgi:allantoinase